MSSAAKSIWTSLFGQAPIPGWNSEDGKDSQNIHQFLVNFRADSRLKFGTGTHVTHSSMQVSPGADIAVANVSWCNGSFPP